MGWFQRIKIRVKRQEKNKPTPRLLPPPKPKAPPKSYPISADRNLAAFQALRDCGFSLPEIRGALLKLARINVAEVARNSDITAPTIYAAAYGKRANQRGRELVAQHLGLPISVLFPEDDDAATNS